MVPRAALGGRAGRTSAAPRPAPAPRPPAGVLLVQFATRLSPRLVVVAAAVALVTLAAVLCPLAYARWRANEVATRQSRPPPPTRSIPLTAAVLGIVAAALGALVLTSG